MQVEELLLTRFAGRVDDYARQLDNGRYMRASEPLTPEVMLRHVRGEITAAVYQLRVCADGTPLSRTALLDFDTGDGLAQAVVIWKYWQRRGIPSLIEMSREGRAHLWLFFRDPLPTPLVRRALSGTLVDADIDCEGVEIFPKSDYLSPEQFGNTTRLPLGLHRKCSPPHRFGFYDPTTGGALSRKWEAQTAHLKGVEDTDRAALEALAMLAPDPPQPAPPPRTHRANGAAATGGVIARLNTALLDHYGSLAGVVAQFTDAPNAKGWTKCPFHQDRHPSMRVDERWQRAVCYTCTPQRANLRFATFDAFEIVAQARFNGDKRTATRTLAKELL